MPTIRESRFGTATVDAVQKAGFNFKYVFGGVGAFFVLILLLSSYTVIRPGNTGVVFNRWTGSLRTSSQGMTPKVPFITDVQSYPTSLRTYTMVKRSGEGSNTGDDSIDLPTREGQHIRQDISVTYNTSEASADKVFRSFRGADIEDIENTYIRRTIITVAQNIAGSMSLSELISSKRDDLQQAVQKNLSVELAKMGFTLDKVNLGASHLPEAIEQQMQQKMAAQQQAQQAEYELQKQELLAKATVAKAQGEAQASLALADAEAKANAMKQKTLTSELIRYETVQKWDGRLPQVSGGATPFINIKSLGSSKDE